MPRTITDDDFDQIARLLKRHKEGGDIQNVVTALQALVQIVQRELTERKS